MTGPDDVEPVANLTLAARINRLFAAAEGADARPPSNKAVAEGVSSLGTPLSESGLYYLRTGARDNPSMRHLEGLARYFGVPVSYFFEDGEQTQRLYDELELVQAMRDSDVRDLALRGADMTPEERRSLIEMLKQLKPTSRRTADGDKNDPSAGH